MAFSFPTMGPRPGMMTPGGGMTGAPLQGNPGVGMVPGVPGSMGTNPGMARPDIGPNPGGYAPMFAHDFGMGSWLQQMPTMAGSPQDFHSQLMAWRQQMPRLGGYNQP